MNAIKILVVICSVILFVNAREIKRSQQDQIEAMIEELEKDAENMMEDEKYIEEKFRDEREKNDGKEFGTSPYTEDPGTGSPSTEDPETGSPPTEDPGAGSPSTEDPETGSPPTEDPGAGSPYTEDPETGSPYYTEDPGTGSPYTEDPAQEVMNKIINILEGAESSVMNKIDNILEDEEPKAKMGLKMVRKAYRFMLKKITDN